MLTTRTKTLSLLRLKSSCSKLVGRLLGHFLSNWTTQPLKDSWCFIYPVPTHTTICPRCDLSVLLVLWMNKNLGFRMVDCLMFQHINLPRSGLLQQCETDWLTAAAFTLIYRRQRQHVLQGDVSEQLFVTQVRSLRLHIGEFPCSL